MPLKPLAGVKLNAEEKPKTAEIPTIDVDSVIVERYGKAKAAYDEAEATMKELRPFILDHALPHIFSHNCDPNCLKPLASVKLKDSKGAVCNVQFQNKYGAVAAEPVEEFFEDRKKLDINDYIVETVAASFDSTIWLDADGNFNKKLYERFRAAIEKVCVENNLFDSEGNLRNPLATKRVVVVRPNFHERRFKDFAADDQTALSEVLPNTSAIKIMPTVTPSKDKQEHPLDTMLRKKAR